MTLRFKTEAEYQKFLERFEVKTDGDSAARQPVSSTSPVPRRQEREVYNDCAVTERGIRLILWITGIGLALAYLFVRVAE